MKFSFFFLLSFSVWANTPYHIVDCLNSNFDLSIEHPVLPFGLLKKSLSFNKNGCNIVVTSTSYFFLSKKWSLDVCRHPVHLKKGRNPVEVLKKEGSCKSFKTTEDLFCNEVEVLNKLIQDDGLIFAEGEKEFLTTDHGKTFCIHQLLSSYWEKDRVFSRYEEKKPQGTSRKPAYGQKRKTLRILRLGPGLF